MPTYTQSSLMLSMVAPPPEVAARPDKFLTTTFYNIGPALLCNFAASGLSLRRCNVDRAFWSIGGGGVGQSLFTHLIASVVGRHNHHFLDMNCYYSDDELRKQGEYLAGKLVVTGQEMPDTNKPMREDLYKKTCVCRPGTCAIALCDCYKAGGTHGLEAVRDE